MVELKPITADNFVDVFGLRLAPGQEEWVSHPIRSPAQAYVCRDQYQPFGICAGGRLPAITHTGYAMTSSGFE